jgi:GxxExxY protein
VVDGLVVVELKSLDAVAAVHKKQLLTYLKLMDKRAGLLLTFGAAHLRDGIARIANNMHDAPTSLESTRGEA